MDCVLGPAGRGGRSPSPGHFTDNGCGAIRGIPTSTMRRAMDALRVLLLAGESEAADWVEAGLAASGLSCRARRVPSRTALAAALRGRAPDLILAVPGPAGLDAAEARRRTVRRWPE